MSATVIVFVMVRVGVDGGMVIGRETIDPNLEHILLVDRQKSREPISRSAKGRE